MVYDYPSTINFSEGFVGMFKYLNIITNNWFAKLLLIAIFVIFASGFYFSKRDVFGGFAVGGFACFIIGLLFWISGVIGLPTFVIVVGVAIISFATLWIGSQD